MTNGFPIYKKTANTGEKGVNAVSSIVNDKFGWIFRRNSNEYDYGIDGYLDLVTDAGAVTGQCFAVQIKTGQSFFKQKSQHGFIFYGDQKHLNYYLNSSAPVLIVVHDDVTSKTYWQHFSRATIEGTATGWKAEIPFVNLLEQGKDKLLEIIGPSTDYAEELNAHWAFNKELQQYDFIHYAVNRQDVETLDISHILAFFKRIEASDALCKKFQGRIEISISGYDTDPRELWEIKQVVRWFKRADPEIKWFFFSNMKSPVRGFLCYLSCMCNARRAKKKSRSKQGSILVELDLQQYPYILESNFEKLNYMTDRLGMPMEENKRITFEVFNVMPLPNSHGS